MSMNLYVRASATFKTRKGYRVTVEHFDLWQTPTKVTDAALKSDNPFAVYSEWASSSGTPEWQEHVDELEEWLGMHYDEGWKIEWYTI